MDLLKIKKSFGDRIALIGGMDVRTLIYERSRPRAPRVGGEGARRDGRQRLRLAGRSQRARPGELRNVQYFVEKGLEMGTYR